MPSYVSAELTHFVGAGKPSDDDRFDLLLTILRTGKLIDGRSMHRKEKKPVAWFDIYDRKGTEERAEYVAEPYFDTDLRKELATNDFVRPDMVCFCDIPHDPIDFFRVHTSKYKRFGIALPRQLLVAQGASPVFYVARAARTPMQLIGRGPHPDFYRDASYPSLFGTDKSRGELFTGQALRILDLIDGKGKSEQDRLDRYKVGESDAKEGKLALHRALDLPVTLFAYLFGYMKFFDSDLSEEHPDNYYMEREWRVLGQARFALSDVVRLFMPPEYVARLRQELPEYRGQVIQLPEWAAG